MIARLWWKEARQFWPIWLFLALVACAGQWLVLRYEARPDWGVWLPPLALGWTCLYGFVAGAAAFAGERETRTLTFLDTLPVGRWRLWGGKSSFALATTVALGAALFAMAAAMTDHWDTGAVPETAAAFGYAALVLELLGWGLFWSAASGSALGAAALAVCSAGLVAPAISGVLRFDPEGLAQVAYLRLGLGALTAALSALSFTASPPPLSAPWQRSRRARGPAPERASTPRPFPPAPAIAPAPALGSRPVSARLSPFVSLVWQAGREAVSIGWRLVCLGILLPLLLALLVGNDVLWAALLLNVFVAILAGVSVFGPEHRAGGQRFLAQRGVRPGLVWLARNGVWAFLILALWSPLMGLIAVGVFRGEFRWEVAPPIYLALIFNAIAVGELCGMTIRRAVTAVVVTIAGVIALVLPLGFLLSSSMLPVPALMLPPLVLLAVSGAWSGDWLLERPGAGRWVRLGLLIVVPFGLLFATYAAYRAWEVPEPAPLPAAQLVRYEAEADSGPSTPSEDAAALYRQAANQIPDNPEVFADRLEGGQALDLIRRASALPSCRFEPIAWNSTRARTDDFLVDKLSRLLTASVRGRQARGDLAGAWDDLLVFFRMARHFQGKVGITTAYRGLSCELDALGLAMSWAADPKQTPERLHAAIDSIKTMPDSREAASSTVAFEASAIERLLARPADDVFSTVSALFSTRDGNALAFAQFEAATTRWEIARARRAFRLLFAAALADARKEPYQRLPSPWNVPNGPSNAGGWSAFRAGDLLSRPVQGHELTAVMDTTPLAKFLFPNVNPLVRSYDRNEVARRALVQVMAVRSWQLRHDGRLPESLVELVPSELDRLPVDPYSERPFRYVRATNQKLPPIGQLQPLAPSSKEVRRMKGRMLLYSVGPDRVDNNAESPVGRESHDLVFPLPPAKGEKSPEAADAEVRAKALAVLDRVLALEFVGPGDPSPLKACQAFARTVRDEIKGVKEGDVPDPPRAPGMMAVMGGMAGVPQAAGVSPENLAQGDDPFAVLLKFVGSHEKMSEKEWGDHYEVVAANFGNLLAQAVGRGRVRPGPGAP